MEFAVSLAARGGGFQLENCLCRKRHPRGFALVVTLSLMVLLTVIAVGLLSLSSITLRSSGSGTAQARANANARMALMMAIGELQKNAGLDTWVTVDSSMSATAKQSRVVGCWKSWSPGFYKVPTQTAPTYSTTKSPLFRTWLASSPNYSELTDSKWPETAVGSDWVRLFATNQDGFDLSAPKVPTPGGSMAWIVSQEATKAKINVAGPEDKDELANVALQVQSRPTLALASKLSAPTSNWNTRAARILSMNQVGLDTALASNAKNAASAGASYTVHSQGLLTDAVRGGLKIDLNLAFELSDTDFAKTTWGTVANPFLSPNTAYGVTSPSAYKKQIPIYRPLLANPIVSLTTSFDPASVSHRFYAGAAPTFSHLRSFYRIPRHLYGSDPTVAERAADHVAITVPSADSGTFFAPANPPPASSSSLAIRPVLNRVIFLLSTKLGPDDKVRLVLTPIVCLWNPYNAALEIDGAVAYPWIDMPFNMTWRVRTATGQNNYTTGMARMMGKQFEAQQHGRSVDPYFLCEMTAAGDGSTNTPIRFQPGEVRVFAPTSATPIEFIRKGNNAARTVRMRPVDDISMFNTRGGLAIPTSGVIANDGGMQNVVIKQGDTVQIYFEAAGNKNGTEGDYNYFVTLEDSARIKNPADSTRGLAVMDVHMPKFKSSTGTIDNLPAYSYDELKKATPPFAVIETFHRVAKQGSAGQAVADLFNTTNPRQISINPLLAYGNFKIAAPHFQSTLRPVSSFNGAIQTTLNGRDAFWGPSQDSTAKDHLPMFEIPREPLLSLAAFQNADLSSSTFAPSHQIGNSFASAYLAPERTAFLDTTRVGGGVPIYDTSYLANEALWDGYFFSGAVPTLTPASSSSPSQAWLQPIANVTRSTDTALKEFIANPIANPLASSRMRLLKRGYNDTDLLARLTDPAGCTRIASHLTVDGAFNINSTDVEAWTAVLAGARGKTIAVESGTSPGASDTAFPRFRHPVGSTTDNWLGFRSLSDAQIRTLATNIVNEVRKRGPFLSLAEFVNRRVEKSDLGKMGAIQAAIEAANFNASAKQAAFDTSLYPDEGRPNIIADTGVDTPGYLTQADVLQSLAPVITCRSDTFTIRGYGEAKSPDGKIVLAKAWCEAIVQRVPDFVDPSSAADSLIASVSPLNQIFGRHFQIISFRNLTAADVR